MKPGYVVSLTLSLLVASMAFASDYADEWGPAAGTPIPADSFTSHTGETRTFLDLMGDSGLLILFNRSANW